MSHKTIVDNNNQKSKRMKVSQVFKQLTVVSAALFAAVGVTFGADTNTVVAKGVGVVPKVPSKTRIVKIQLNEITAVAAQKGWLKEEYAKINAKVELVDLGSLSILGVEASMLDRGDLHITSRMAYPALQHRANGLDAVVIWQGVNPQPRRATIIVLKDSPIKSIDDLVGKTFGSSLIGCPYYAGREGIKAAGHDVDTDFERGDIRFVNITGVAGNAAFLSGKLDAYGTHPGIKTIAPLYTQDQVREISVAVPGGTYLTSGGRALYFAMRKWSIENPDLVKAFLTVYGKTQRWVVGDGNYEEAANIIARETRVPKHVALYDIKDESKIVYDWGQPDYDDAVASIKFFQNWAISIKDPFYTKHKLSDKDIEAFVDKRFFKGGEYFVDTSEKALKGFASVSNTNAETVKVLAQAGNRN